MISNSNTYTDTHFCIEIQKPHFAPTLSPPVLTSKSILCRVCTSSSRMLLLYTSWASWAITSDCGSWSGVPYNMFFIVTSVLDTSSDACHSDNSHVMYVSTHGDRTTVMSCTYRHMVTGQQSCHVRIDTW